MYLQWVDRYLCVCNRRLEVVLRLTNKQSDNVTHSLCIIAYR